jgi:TRAP-type uncharacterized transport system substrate-binding protein
MLSVRIKRNGYQLSLIIIAAVLLAFAAYRLASLWLVPEVSIGVSQSSEEFGKLFSALSRVADPDVLKISVRTFANSKDVASAVEQKAIDFAAIRPDVDLPANGMTIAILQENPIVLVSWGAAKITRANQFAGRRLAALSMDDATIATLRRVLGAHQATDVKIVTLDGGIDSVKAAISAKEIDGFAISGRPDLLRQIVGGLLEIKPVMIPLPAVFGESLPEMGVATIAAKSLPGDIPEEETETISTSYRLVARRDVDRATVNTFLQVLFSQRIALARESQLAWQMKGLEDEGATFAKLPNHRGALDYYNREQQTFMDLYGDWLWLALFAAGGFSSAGAWLMQILSRRRKQLVENVLDRLLEILGEAREAADVDTLDKLTVEIDGLVTHAIRQARWRASEPMATTALTLAIDSSRAAVNDRRIALLRITGNAASASLRARGLIS